MQDIRGRGYRTKEVIAYGKYLLKREEYSILHRPAVVEARVKTI